MTIVMRHTHIMVGGQEIMPSVSEKQRRAMQAAAHGNSTLGIPKSVGQDFAAADKKAGSKKLPMKKKPVAKKPFKATGKGKR
jgi:hypothetical protein